MRAGKTVVAVVVGGLAVAVLVGLWFQPWKLFVDEVVSEGLPPSQPVARESPVTTGTPPQRTLLSTGAFRDLEHDTQGVAKVFRLEDGSLLVRLEGFRTSNGPDLVVLLSDTPATEDAWRAYDDGAFVNIGRLKGNIGDQNYRLRPNIDLSKFRSVVIWCRRFSVGFGAAPIRLGA